MYSTRHSGVGAEDRAASALIGLVLLFGLVFAGAGIIYWAGMDAKQSVQTASEVDTAETSLQEVSSKLSDISFKGDGAVTSFDLSGKDPSDVRIVDDGKIHFSLNGKSACRASSDLGSIVYENDNGDTVAYQGGAVFKQTEGSVTIVQSPRLDYRTEIVDSTNVRTIRFPVTNVDGDVRSSGTVTASANASTEETFEEDLCLTGSNTDEIDYVREVKITVEGSSYYEAWAQYFREEFGASGAVTVDDANEKVTVVAPLGSGVTPDQFTIDDEQIYGAIFSGASAGQLDLQTNHALVNSYDSTNGPWGGAEPTYGSDGTIITRGDVKVSAGGMVDGNVYAEGDVDLGPCTGGSNCVNGDVYVNNSTSGAGGPTTALTPTSTSGRNDVIAGDWGNGTIVPDVPTMDATIDDTLSTVDEYNNNDDVSVVSGEQIQFPSGSATVESGVYYLDELTVPNSGTLTLDTSSGDIVFAVDGDVDIGNDARVEVTGPGQVRTFVGESTGSDDQLTVGGEAKVTVTDGGTRTYRSNAFFVACKAGCSASFKQGSGGTYTEFTGVLYGPGDAADDGTVKLGKFVDVWGALVSGTVTFEQQSEFHFDTTLKNSDLDADGDGVPDVVDDDNGFPDGDGDGFSDSEDDCENVAGTGENGCAGVTENEAANTLIVNQSSATLTIIGSQIANEKTVETTDETRSPLNVELVIDDSGSMNYYENWGFERPNGWKTYNYEGGPYQIASWGDWSDYEDAGPASYVQVGQEDGPPADSDRQWTVKWTETSCFLFWCSDTTQTEVLDPGETKDIEASYDVRYREVTGSSVTVPDGTAYVADDDGYGGIESDSKVFYPGETIDPANWSYYHEIDIDGNDVYWERLNASETFVSALNSSKDEVGVVRFDSVSTDEQPLTSTFDDVNETLTRDSFTSDDGTNIYSSLQDAIDNLDDADETRDGLETRDTIVLLTDGKHSDGLATDEDDIRTLADRAHDKQIRVYVVALGDESDYNKDLLEYIATEDGALNESVNGSLYEVESAGELNENFTKIANDSKTETKQIIQHTNTSTTIHMGGDDVPFGENTNPTDGSYPSTTVDAGLDVGDAVHFSSTMYQCDGNTTFDTTTSPAGDEYDEAYCENTGSADEQTTNGDDTKHRIFTDGDTIPTVDTSAWYKDGSMNSLEKIVEDYDASLTDGNTFSIPKNDAIILVEIEDGEPDDRDFMVVYFDANDQDPPDPDDQTVDVPEDDDEDDTDTGDGTSNDFVVSIGFSDVNVSSGNPSVVPATATVAAPTDGFTAAHDTVAGAWTATMAVDVRD
jgi:Mg-chelatase subunit ChlD